jgi:DNA-binding NtrC family response regulator
VSEKQTKVLVVDDDPEFLRFVEFLLEKNGYAGQTVTTGEQALQFLAEHPVDAILLDRQLGEQDGLELIEPIQQRAPEVPIILATADSSVESAVKAIKLGAYDYLDKPIDEARLVAMLGNVTEHRRLLERVRTLEEERKGRDRFEQIVGASPEMQTVYRIIENVAPTDAPVMIVGESGTGKELVARALHAWSRRNEKPFVAINMGAVPKDLFESTLFGHERGAFTGAERARVGCCEAASGGTLFFDEIREMPYETQPKLLRYLQEKTLRRVGGAKDIESDARVVTATNADPLADVRDKKLRADLYYRLNVVPIRLPALRDRRGDIPLLVDHVLQQLSGRHGKSFDGVEPAALERLAAHPWPGNVRQLIHLLERVIILNPGPVVTNAMVAPELDAEGALEADSLPTASPTPTPPESKAALPSSGPAGAGGPSDEIVPLAQLERDAIRRAVAQCGSAAKAARLLGISEATIYRRLREYGLETGGNG